ncbi:MAG: KEOPS complex subunit Pcc1 [Thermoplasmata archaeon]
MSENSLITASLKIVIGNNEASEFLKSLEPDNHGRIDAFELNDGVEVTIRDEKISTIVNVIDDLLRCFDVFEKIEGR